MQLIRTWGNTERPWGYEIRADFGHDGKIYNEVMAFPSVPDQQEIDATLSDIQSKLETQLGAEQVPSEVAMVSEKSVEEAKIDEQPVSKNLKSYLLMEMVAQVADEKLTEQILTLMDKISIELSEKEKSYLDTRSEVSAATAEGIK